MSTPLNAVLEIVGAVLLVSAIVLIVFVPEKAFAPMVVMVAGKETFVAFVQFVNAFAEILFTV